MRYRLFILLSMVLLSCKGKNELPAGIMKPEKMQIVFWDYIRAEVYTTEYLLKDSTKDAIKENLAIQEKIFKLHNITKDEFYKSYTYYSNHKELMTKMLDSMMAKQRRDLPVVPTRKIPKKIV